MEIVDVLIGEQSVIVKQENGDNLEFDRDSDGFVTTPRNQIPDQIVDEFKTRSIPMTSEFPKQETLYAHDERAYTTSEVAEAFEMDENMPVFESVAGLTYEIPFTVVIEDRDTWKITHAFGKKLEEPYYY